MGKVQTSSRGSTKQAGRWTWTGVCVGTGHKRDSDRARAQKEHKRNSGVRTDSRVTVEAAPRARTTDFGKDGVAADIFGARHTRLATEKWVMERMQGMIQKISC